MPTYEMTVIFKTLPKEELFAAVKRAGSRILSTGGLLRDLQSLGVDVPTPFRISKHGRPNRQGSYFLYTFDSPTSTVAAIRKKYDYDVDIIRSFVSLKKTEFHPKVCNLEDELKPPPYRKEVQKIVEHEEKKKKVKFPLNTGLDYNPFP